MHFLASTLSVLGIALFYCRLFRRSLAQVISAAVFSICIALYVLSIAGIPLRASCSLMMGAGWLCLLGSGIAACKKRGASFAGNLPALLAFGLFAAYTYTLLYDKLAIGWDEFSHWMLSVKNMHYFNSLGLGALSSTEYQSYPPALQLFESFYLIFYPEFQESGAFLGRTMLLISTLFAPAFHKTKNPVWAMVKLLILFASPIAFYSSVYSMLYVDAALGMLFAHLVWLYYAEDRFDGFFVFHYVLCASVLALIKGSGIALVLFALLIIVLDFVFGRPQPLRRLAQEHRRSFLTRSAILALAPLAVYFSWKLYLNVFGIGDYWNPGASITPQSLLTLISAPEAYQVQTLSSFIGNLRTSFSLGRFHLSFARYPVFFLSACVLAGICAGSLKRGILVGASLSASYCVYVLSVLLTYLFLFTPEEAVTNASFRRYMNSQALACCMSILPLMLNVSVLSRHPHQVLPAFSFKQVRIIPGKMLPALLALSFPLLSASGVTAVQLYLNARNDAQYVSDFRADLSLLEQTAQGLENKESRIWYIHQTCNGDRYYLARLLCAPVRLNMRGFSLAASSSSAANSYSVIKTPQEWADELAAMYDYVYCDQINKAFIADYGELFESPEDIAKRSLYQVVAPQDGEGPVKLKLISRE